MDAAAVVDAFIAGVVAKDLDAALALATEDIEYDNVPMPTVHGHDGVRGFLEPMLGVDEVQFVVHRQVVSGTTVMNERLDRFRVGDRWIELPVAGVFEVTDGKVSLWRDYFDLATLNDAIAALAEQ